MPLTIPRDMMSGICWERSRLVLQRSQQLARSANGIVQAKDLGPSYWRADQFASYPMRNAEADLWMSDFLSLKGAVNSFYAYDAKRARPISLTGQPDPDLSGITVSAVAANRSQLSLTGLPAGFTVQGGDYISVRTSIGGREYFRIVRAWLDQYDGLGTTPLMEVEPYIRITVGAGDIVDLIKPLIEMRLEPGSLDDPYVNRHMRRITFSAQQVIR